MALLPTPWYEERNTEDFKAWLTANGINLAIVPEDAEISVTNGIIRYERLRWDMQGNFEIDPRTATPLRITATTKEIVQSGKD